MIPRILAAALTTVLVVPVAAGPVSAAPAAPDGAGSAAMVEAIVVLRDQVDPAGLAAASRHQRQTALVRALRALAASEQRGILELLRTRQAQGLVARATPLWVLNAVAVRARPSVILELAARPEVGQIEPDTTIRAPAPTTTVTDGGTAVEPNVAAVNAPALWDLGIRGQGTVVANMDTGVDATHPDLAGRWRGGANSWYDPNGQHPTVPTDVNGHGTATMGVMVGGSAGGTSIGVAPDATWIAVKIFNDQGSASTSAIHLGFQWLLDPDGNPATPDAPDVVDNSWTGSAGGCVLDFQPDLRNLRAAGIVPVFAAGNYGPTASTVLSPANLPEALSVGGVDDAGVIDGTSSRGPSACGQAIAPRVVAPGVGVHTTDLYAGYLDASGTSLAAPHAAGVLALLLSAYPDLTADRQQTALESAAVDLGAAGADNTYGYGRVDALGAYQWLAAAPDFTVAVAPSEATTTPGGGVSYTVSVSPVNGFAGDVALSLDGLTASQAAWTFSPSVIPGGDGTAQLGVTTAATIVPGTYPLTVTGTSAGTTRSRTVNLVVSAPADFTLAASPASRTVPAGSATTYTVSVTALNGYPGPTALSLSGLPAAVGTATFTPAAVGGTGTATLAVSTLSGAPEGTYPLTVSGTGGGYAHTATVALVVTRPDFTLSAAPSTVSVARGQTAGFTVSTTAVGGFTGLVTLSLSGAPSGTVVGFSTNPIGAPGSTTLTVKTRRSTPRGTYALTVTGTSGSLVHTVTVWMTVS